MDKLHKNHIRYIKHLQKSYSKLWFHGNGQIYIDQQKSETAAKYAIAGSYADYVLEINSNEIIPDNLDDLKNKFLNSKAKSDYQKNNPFLQKTINTFSLPKEETISDYEPQNYEIQEPEIIKTEDVNFDYKKKNIKKH